MATLEELKNTPINCSSYFPWSDYMENKEECEKEISKIQLNNVSKEPLVSCGNDIFNHNYYYEHKVSKMLSGVDVKKNVYLRKSILNTLLKVDKFLRKNGLCLFLRNGYRSVELQRAASSNWRKLEDENKAKIRFSHSTFPPHSTGGVFDTEIFDIKKNICLYTKSKSVNGIYPYQRLEKENLLGEWIEIRENIRLLHNILTKPYILDESEVFIPHPYESWHYGRGDRHSKFFSNDHNYKVIYDTIKNPASCLQ